MGTTAAVTVPVAGGFGGLIVAPVVGPVIDLSGPDMPLTTAIGTQDAPNGFQFSRPRIVDPDLDTAAGPQAGGKEKAELPSKKFDLASDLVSMSTIGNYLNLSLQAETFVPGALDIVVRQLNRRTSRGIEKATVAAITDASKVIPLADSATAAEVQAALFAGAAAVFTATGRMPTWIAVGPLGWARLGALTDLAGRPIFPSLNPVNAVGTADIAGDLQIAGIRTIVTAGITDEDIFMGNCDRVGALLLPLPAALGDGAVAARQAARRGGVARQLQATDDRSRTGQHSAGGLRGDRQDRRLTDDDRLLRRVVSAELVRSAGRPGDRSDGRHPGHVDAGGINSAGDRRRAAGRLRSRLSGFGLDVRPVRADRHGRRCRQSDVDGYGMGRRSCSARRSHEVHVEAAAEATPTSGREGLLMAAPFPPAAPPWDGDPMKLVEFARVRLNLAVDDPDLPWLAQLADSVVELIARYVDSPASVFDGGSVLPSITTASVLALIDAYRRKDATFGIIGAWSPDGVALRVSRDWLDGVKASLQPHRVRFGVA